jgi:Protein of unknown function (DUF4232)
MRVRSIVAAVVMAGMALGATACAGAGGSGRDQSGAVTAGQAAASGVADAVNAKSSTHLAAEVSVQRANVALITLMNNGSSPVTVDGWPELDFTNAHGDHVSVPVQQVEVPTPAQTLTIPPGSAVFAPMTWVEGDKSEDDTVVADGVEVIPPGASRGVETRVIALDGTEPGYYEFALKSIKIGTFQESTHNILTF